MPSRGGRVALLVVVLDALEAVGRVRETRVLPPRVRGGRGGWRTGERATNAARAVPGGRLVWVDAEHSQVLAGGREERGERAQWRTRRRPRPAPSSQRAPGAAPSARPLSLSLTHRSRSLLLVRLACRTARPPLSRRRCATPARPAQTPPPSSLPTRFAPDVSRSELLVLIAPLAEVQRSGPPSRPLAAVRGSAWPLRRRRLRHGRAPRRSRAARTSTSTCALRRRA